MALPNDVTTFELTFGPYTDAAGEPVFAGMTGKIKPSFPQIRHVASGAVVIDAAIPVEIDAFGVGSVTLAHTDQAVLSPVGFTYSVAWDVASRKPSPGNKQFAVPQSAGDVVDFDLLAPSPDVEGVVVPLTFGKSAYDLAVENGFVGTENAWLASLVGPMGSVTPTDLATGLATKVNSSTYTAGLAGKQDVATLDAATATNVTSGAATSAALRAAFGLSVAATATADAALAVGKFTPVDATAVARTMTLPTGAADGVTIGVEKVDASANAVTVTGNIRGVPTTTIPLPWQHETLLLRADSTGSWWPVAGHKTKASLDAAYAARPMLSGTYPMRQLAKKVAAQNAGTAQVLWLTFGDSYGQKLWQGISTVLIRALGTQQVGAVFAGNLGVTNNTSTGTVTDNTADFAHWTTGLTTTLGSAGASRTYGMGGTTALCDTIKVYWINAGGGFKIQVDGVDNTTPTVTSDNSLGSASITVARGSHTVTLVQTSGTPTVLGVGFIDSTTSGVVVVNVSQGGWDMPSTTAQGWTNFQTFLTALSPDVMTFEMKEGSSTLPGNLATLFAKTAAGAPNMDVIGIGSPPIAVNDADQVLQNSQLSAACATAGYMYWDSYAPFGSYAKLTAMGMNGDGTHVSGGADAYRGTLFLRDLGILPALPGHPLPLDVRASLVEAINRLVMGADPLNRQLDVTVDANGLDMHVKARRNIIFEAPDGTKKFVVNLQAPGSNGAVGFNGMWGQNPPTLPAAATDLASTITLVNAIRTALINYGLTF